MGWIFTQSTRERAFIMSSEEVQQAAALQAEVGEAAVTGVVGLAVSEDGSDVHFEVSVGAIFCCLNGLLSPYPRIPMLSWAMHQSV